MEAIRCDPTIWDNECVMLRCRSKHKHSTGQCFLIEAAMWRYPEYELFGLERFRVPMRCTDCTCLVDGTKERKGDCEHCRLECYCPRRRFVVEDDSSTVDEEESESEMKLSKPKIQFEVRQI